jgi:hypothetical protein
VLFLIGMRINKLWAVSKWGRVFVAMPPMIRELQQNKDSGFLHQRTYVSGRNVLGVQYWDSFEKMLAYAQDREGKHFPAWAAFNRAIGNDGSVGIWHESYLVEPGKFESIYVNMPRFGLGLAADHVPAQGRMSQAKGRIAHAEG